MKIATLDDAVVVTYIVTHPAIWAVTAPDDSPEFDAMLWLRRPHIGLLVQGGCFLGMYYGAGRYDVHTNFLPDARGRNALKEASKALEHMFLCEDAEALTTHVPENNKPAEWMTRKMGFQHLFSRDGTWLKNNVAYSQSYYELTLDAWIRSGACKPLGQSFHEKLHKSIPEDHAQDDIHDCYVGAIYAMMKSGNVQKAIRTYNRWAVFAGYAPIKLLSTNPLRIDIQNAILRIDGATFTVEA